MGSALKRIRALERRLARTTAELSAVRAFATSRLDAAAGSNQGDETLSSNGPAPPQPRDDDSHYFESYGENGQCLTLLRQ
jgi:protein arginine N-methyltransferase 3